MNQKHILKISRLEALFDGVFAIAMTILILDLHLPLGEDPAKLLATLTNDILRKLFIYAGSFIILGTLWVAMTFQHGFLEKVNRRYFWANIIYLMIVCVVPFSASFFASYHNSPISISFFAVNLLCASLMQFVVLQSSHSHQLFCEEYNPRIRKAVYKRIFVAPIFYLASLVVAHWSTIIAFMLLVIPPLSYLIPGTIDKYAREEG